MTLDKLIPKEVRLVGGFVLALGTAVYSHLPNLCTALTSRGIVATQNETISARGKSINCDIYVDKFDNSNLNFDFVVIDELLDTAEQSAVESVHGKYIVCPDDSSKADSIDNEINQAPVSLDYNKVLTRARKISIYPNPSYSTSTLDFLVEREGNVLISAYQIGGEKVRDVFNARLGKGSHSLGLNLSNIPLGVYEIMISTPTYKKSEKVLLLK